MKSLLIICIFCVILLNVESVVKVYQCDKDLKDPDFKHDSNNIRDLEIDFYDDIKDLKTKGAPCTAGNCIWYKQKWANFNFLILTNAKTAKLYMDLTWNILVEREGVKRGIQLKYLDRDITSLANKNGHLEKKSFVDLVANVAIGDLLSLKLSDYHFFVPSLFYTGEFNMTIAIRLESGSLNQNKQVACGVVHGDFRD